MISLRAQEILPCQLDRRIKIVNLITWPHAEVVECGCNRKFIGLLSSRLVKHETKIQHSINMILIWKKLVAHVLFVAPNNFLDEFDFCNN